MSRAMTPEEYKRLRAQHRARHAARERELNRRATRIMLGLAAAALATFALAILVMP